MFTFTDIILSAIALICIGSGFHYGFIRALGSLIGLIIGSLLGYFGLIWFSDNIANLDGHTIWNVSIFFIIMIICSQLVGLLFELADKIWKIFSIIPFLSSINKLLGGILGIAEAIILLSAISFFSQNFIANETVLSNINNSFMMERLSLIKNIFIWIYNLSNI